MDKLSHHLHIRLTEDEHERLQTLMRGVGADRSSMARLALKRLFRKPPQKRFRFRLNGGQAMKRPPIKRYSSLEQMIGPGTTPVTSCAWFIKLTHLGSIEIPYGDAYLWIVCEEGGGYFSKTDYLSRAIYFATQACEQEFLTVFPFIEGKSLPGSCLKGGTLQ